ncbi:MAG: thioredoxin family protein [Holosporales bacterium]|jgi:thiol:disulfide interchange protein DsbD|nr:thioredoxin family protein [Holosporales bacterium]
MFSRRVFSFLSLLLLVFPFSILSSEFSSRTSVDSFDEESVFFVSFDFSLPRECHVTAPVGKGGSIAPKVSWKNAELLEAFWPKSEKLFDADGRYNGYRGYSEHFSIIYKLKVKDRLKPVSYDLFYVVCGDACIPKEESGTLTLDGLLLENEIVKATKDSKVTLPTTSVLLVLALLGGIILNFMPCVFPIISIKMFSILRLSRNSRSSIRKHGLSVFLGMLTTFLLLGLIFSLLKGSAHDIGWGFYMQEPWFIVLLLLLFLLSALHFLEIFTFQIFRMKRIKLSPSNAYVSSFLSGALGAIVSSSCVCPFSGIAIAGALLYGSFFRSLAIFLLFGIGFAFPFLIISVFPGIVNKLPKPGKWLERFKEFAGVALFFSCIWPISILIDQLSHSQLIAILTAVTAIPFLLIGLGRIKNLNFLKIIPLLGIAGTIYIALNVAHLKSENEDSIDWKEYSDQLFEEAKESKRPIFLDFTATWCLTCQVNRRIFSDKNVIDAFKKNDVLAIKCDWTKQNDEVTKLMRKYNSAAVPLYVYHHSGDNEDFLILPTILRKKVLLDLFGSNGREK